MTTDDFNSTELLFVAAESLADAESLRREYASLTDASDKENLGTPFESGAAHAAGKRLASLPLKRVKLLAKNEDALSRVTEALEMKTDERKYFDDKFLGQRVLGKMTYTFLGIHPQSVLRAKKKARLITKRNRGVSLDRVLSELGRFTDGWVAGKATTRSTRLAKRHFPVVGRVPKKCDPGASSPVFKS